MTPLLAASQHVTPLEKLQNVSGQFWMMVIIGILVLAVIIFIFRKVAGMNKIILTILLAVVLSIVMLNWIYNRNEPSWMTWLVDPIASSGFLPTKGTYDAKQQQDPGKPGIQKNAPITKPGTTTTTTTAQPAKK